jgi:hypothetical protein
MYCNKRQEEDYLKFSNDMNGSFCSLDDHLKWMQQQATKKNYLVSQSVAVMSHTWLLIATVSSNTDLKIASIGSLHHLVAAAAP